MKQKILWGVLVALIVSQPLQAQEWQQGVDYTIAVTLNDEAHQLTGTWELVYTNNSPQPLGEIWMHLWPNAYKDNTTAFARQQNNAREDEYLYAGAEERGYIDSLAFTANGEVLSWAYDPHHIDIALLTLPQPLAPGGSVTLHTPFRVQLPSSFSRLGHVDQQYQITQWYPKPAVYDEEGWHPMPYLDKGEFFSEFGSYRVSITLPKNYVVGATGALQEQSEVEWLLRRSKKPLPEDEEDPFPESASELKTLTYVLDSIHDFAWFADKRYLVRHDSVELPTGRRVGLWALFNKQDREVWSEAIQYMKDGLRYYSQRVGEYPYDMCTVVDGALSAGAGMEYPTITVLGGSDAFSLEQVIVHELGHNWFYGVLGTNERADPWMDEGLNSYYEMCYFEHKYPGLMAIRRTQENTQAMRKLLERFGLWHLSFANQYQLGYQITHSLGIDQPLNLPADQYSPTNYAATIYWKTAAALRVLEGYWGLTKYDKIMQAYWQQWGFGHPAPDDFRAVLERESGEDLSWWFEGLMESRLGYDVALVSARQEGEAWVVTVKQTAGVPGPMPVALMKEGEVLALQWARPAPGERVAEVRFLSQDEDMIMVDPHEWLPETNLQNNRYALTQVLKKVEPLRLVPIISGPQPDRTLVHHAPGIGFNPYDGFMLGWSLHNYGLPDRRFTYAVAPYWAFGSRDVVGSYQFRLDPFGELVAGQRVTLSVQGQRYSETQRHTAALVLDGIPLHRRAPVYYRTYLKFHNRVQASAQPGDAAPVPLWGNDNVWEVGEEVWYRAQQFSIEGQVRGWMHADLSRLETTVRTTIGLPKNGDIELRGYFGRQWPTTGIFEDQWLHMDGGRDFLMESYLYDRQGITPGMGAYTRQSIGQAGDFKGPVGVWSGSQLLAFNLEARIPGALGLGVFADVGWAAGTAGAVYDAGLLWKVIPNTVELYYTLAGTNISFQNPGNNFRFLLNLAELNPISLMEKRLR